MIKGYPSKSKRGNQEYGTLQPLGQGKYGQDNASMKLLYRIDGTSYVPEATSTTSQIDLAGHSVQEGDVILFDAGALSGIEVGVISATTNSFQLATDMPSAVTAADTFRILRHKTLEGDSSGNLVVAAAPIQFRRDGAAQEVIEDTVTSANNRPLPVKLTGLTGDINVTANDLNVALDHTNDSTRIGDGTEIMLINAAGEAQVSDDTARVSLASIDGKLNSLGQKASAASAPVVLSTEQEAILSGRATEATLSALNAKFSALGQKASAASAPVVLSTEQEAILSAIDTKLGNIDTQTDDVATETTLAALSAKFNSLGQKSDAGSVPVTLSTTQAAFLDGIEALLSNIDAQTDDVSTETTLLALSAKFGTLGQKASAGSAPVVLSTEQEAKIDNLISESQRDIVDIISPIDVSLSNIPASSAAPLQIIAATSGDITEIQTIEDVGEYIGLYTGAAAAEVLACILPIAGGTVKVRIPSGTRLSIRHMKNSAITDAVYFAANLIG